ncbi:MAG TPA: extracellular solute-binding protein [Caldilineaceae bacterium]|nr:extracellular solute-binding protein [Caldilineaceae bacterium]
MKSLSTSMKQLWWMRVAVLLVLLLLVASCNRNTPTPEPTATPAPVVPSENSGEGASPSGETAAGANTPQATVAQPANAQPAATPTPEPIGTLTLWHSWAEEDGDALATILLTFAQRYPQVRVETLFVAYNDLPQSYADAVQANAGPDLILAPNWWLGEMVNAGVVQSVDALVTAGTLDGALLADFWPATLDNLRWQGTLYGLPTNFEVVALFYNRELVGEQPLPATTDELLKLAQASPQTGVGLYATLYHLYWGFPAYGAQLLDANGRAILDQGNGATDYLTWLATLNRVDGSYIDSDYGMLLDRFKKGEFAFLVDGPWSIGELQGALGDNLAVTTLPAGPVANAQPWLNTDGVFLNPSLDPEQQWLATLFARHITSAESGQTLAQLANRLPANRTVALENPLLQGFMAQGASAEPYPTVPEMAEVWGYGGDLLIKVLDANLDPAEAVLETTTLINEANGK